MSITALGEFELQRIGAEGILPAPTGLLGSDLVFHTYDDKDTEEIAVFDELTLRLSDSLRLTAGARWSETTIDFSANNVSGAIPPRVRDSFELLNFRIGAFQAGSWDVALFMKNATNDHANLSDNRPIAAEKPGRPRIVTNRPRSFGLEVRKDF